MRECLVVGPEAGKMLLDGTDTAAQCGRLEAGTADGRKTIKEHEIVMGNQGKGNWNCIELEMGFQK